MADSIVWEIQLELDDDAAAAFWVLMDDKARPCVDEHGVVGHYDWSLSDDGKMACIFLRYVRPPAVAVRWAGDWAAAERHLSVLGPDFAQRLLALARPVNLVTFGEGGYVAHKYGQSNAADVTGSSDEAGDRIRQLRATTSTPRYMDEDAALGMVAGYPW